MHLATFLHIDPMRQESSTPAYCMYTIETAGYSGWVDMPADQAAGYSSGLHVLRRDYYNTLCVSTSLSRDFTLWILENRYHLRPHILRHTVEFSGSRIFFLGQYVT